jgi:DNA-binding FadR family transcriptional regulator
MLETVKRTKIRDVVAARLKNLIQDENLRPGDRLPTETELASRFGVNRLSLREATKALEFLGIVEATPGRGLTVGRLDMDRITEHLGFHPALHDVALTELIDSRVVLETGVLPLVSQRMREDDSIHRRLTQINESLGQARKLPQFVQLDIDFHRELIAASGLSPLMAFGDLLVVFFQRFRESVKKAEWQGGVRGHQEVIDLLAAGDVAKASQILRWHIESHRERMHLVQ